MSFKKTLVSLVLAGAMAIGGLANKANAHVDMEYVTVGDANNAADTEVMWTDGTTGYGHVDYEFQIGKYEVTNAQYIEFLNAVAKTDTYNLHDNSRHYTGIPDPNRPCSGIERSGESGNYVYSLTKKYPNGTEEDPNWLNRPINYASWNSAVRFCNWMHNGQPIGDQNESTTEDGAYDMSIPTAEIIRKPGAKVWLPSEDEWYKAAFYKGGGTNAGYWNFATQSDVMPTGEFPPGTDLINGSANHCRLLEVDNFADPNYFTTKVGSYSSKIKVWMTSASAYGTFDQSGNVLELNERIIFRGGCWQSSRYYDSSSSYRFPLGWMGPDDYGDGSLGFRVATSAALKGDINRDGIVDFKDFAEFANDWLKQESWYSP